MLCSRDSSSSRMRCRCFSSMWWTKPSACCSVALKAASMFSSWTTFPRRCRTSPHTECSELKRNQPKRSKHFNLTGLSDVTFMDSRPRSFRHFKRFTEDLCCCINNGRLSGFWEQLRADATLSSILNAIITVARWMQVPPRYRY